MPRAGAAWWAARSLPVERPRRADTGPGFHSDVQDRVSSAIARTCNVGTSVDTGARRAQDGVPSRESTSAGPARARAARLVTQGPAGRPHGRRAPPGDEPRPLRAPRVGLGRRGASVVAAGLLPAVPRVHGSLGRGRAARHPSADARGHGPRGGAAAVRRGTRGGFPAREVGAGHVRAGASGGRCSSPRTHGCSRSFPSAAREAPGKERRLSPPPSGPRRGWRTRAPPRPAPPRPSPGGSPLGRCR